MVINTRVKNKRDTNINLESANPIILNGEIVIVDHETEGIKLKIGDGITPYNSLPFYEKVYSEKPTYTYQEILGLEDKLNNLESQIQLIPIIPSGMIMIWSGSETDIPAGWALCNGQNNTPDLTDKFVLGAGNSYNVGDIGGASEHILTIEEMPSHSHSGITEQAGSHSHKIGTDKDTTYVTYGDCWSVHNSSTGATYYNGSTTSNGNHTHSFVTNDTGGNQPHNNMPPYYALCYIIKI